jgi:uncharacterized membrane protein YbhN (UPF0104 family)
MQPPIVRPHAASPLRAWFTGLLVLAGLIALVTHLGEIEEFAALVRHAEPAWLLLALLLQAATYTSTASVWALALGAAGRPQPLRVLVPLCIAKLFSDQAMPSAGFSGSAFLVLALRRREIPESICVGALLLSLLCYYAAAVLAAIATVLLLWLDHAIHPWMIAAVVAFCAIAVGIPSGALSVRAFGGRPLPRVLERIPGLPGLLDAIAHAPLDSLRDPLLVAGGVLLHAAVILLDAATLWVMLQLVGVSASYAVALPAFALASMVATLGLVPLGLGTFEVTCVSVLHLLGVPLEAALAATLLLRGATLWLPMLPGLWLARRALR